MKHILALTALLATTAHAEFMTGNQLLTNLDSSTIAEQTFGIGYVIGVFDVVRGIEHCPPDSVTAGQVKDMVRQHLAANPSIRHVTADVQVRYVLKNAWPCAKKNNGSNL